MGILLLTDIGFMPTNAVSLLPKDDLRVALMIEHKPRGPRFSIPHIQALYMRTNSSSNVPLPRSHFPSIFIFFRVTLLPLLLKFRREAPKAAFGEYPHASPGDAQC